MNTSGIYPSEYNVLVKPRPVEEKTAGGLFLPDIKKEKDEFARMDGTLVAVSPVAFSYAAFPEGTTPQVGESVIFSKYQATEITGADGEKYWIMKDTAIAAVRK